MTRGLLLKLGAFCAVAALLGAMELGTLTGPHAGRTRTYYAMFGGTDGVSGLRPGNPVRVSGVAVGKVTATKLVDATHVRVSFTANRNQALTTATWASVRYANLLGQRYLALSQEAAGAGQPLRAGSTIPQTRTRPALSLTALFNGFRPLFATLTPEQVNRLSGDIIAVLQGQTGTLDDLVVQTAQLTSHLAKRGDTFRQVIDSLTSLLTTTAQHDSQLAGAVTSLHALTTRLQVDGPALLDSLASVDGLIGSVGGLFAALEQHNLPGDIADLRHVTGVLASHTDAVSTLITGFVKAFGTFSRVTQNGNWLNVYPCDVSVIMRGQTSVTAAGVVSALDTALGGAGGLGTLLSQVGLGTQALAALALPLPLTLPNGRVGSGSGHTAVCR